MSKHAARRHRRRRSRVSRGVATLIGVNLLARLVVAQGSASQLAPSSLAGSVGQREESDVPRIAAASRGLDRDEAAVPPPFKTQQGSVFRLKPAVRRAWVRKQNPTVFQVGTLNLLG